MAGHAEAMKKIWYHVMLSRNSLKNKEVDHIGRLEIGRKCAGRKYGRYDGFEVLV